MGRIDLNILLEELSTSESLIVVNMFDVHTRSDHCCAGLAVVLLNKKNLINVSMSDSFSRIL